MKTKVSKHIPFVLSSLQSRRVEGQLQVRN